MQTKVNFNLYKYRKLRGGGSILTLNDIIDQNFNNYQPLNFYCNLITTFDVILSLINYVIYLFQL